TVSAQPRRPRSSRAPGDAGVQHDAMATSVTPGDNGVTHGSMPGVWGDAVAGAVVLPACGTTARAHVEITLEPTSSDANRVGPAPRSTARPGATAPPPSTPLG